MMDDAVLRLLWMYTYAHLMIDHDDVVVDPNNMGSSTIEIINNHWLS